MLDPIIASIKKLFALVIATIKGAIGWIIAPFVWIYTTYKTSGWIIKGILLILIIPFILIYGWFFWAALWIRGYDLAYIDKYEFSNLKTTAGEQV